MALTGAISSVQLSDDASIVARYPTLNSYLAAGMTDWSGQRAVGELEALRSFRLHTGKAPDWCKAEQDEDWLSILSATTLAVIFRGFLPNEQWESAAVTWQNVASAELADFRYREDEDRDGVLEDDPEEAVNTAREIRLVR